MSNVAPETRPVNAALLQSKFQDALSWQQYLATDPERASSWQTIYDQIELTTPQQQLIGGFVRRMPVLCVSGIWCGDCVQQGPLFQRIAEASDCIDLRWLDRDEHMDLASSVKINDGLRVPVLLFMAEDYEPVSVMGDRSLTRYRAIAAKQLGASCPLPGAPIPDAELLGTLQDYLDEFERVQLLLRLSTRLRQLHGD